jgi:hypothetical protein
MPGIDTLRTWNSALPAWLPTLVSISCLSAASGTQALMKWCCSMPIQAFCTCSVGGVSLPYLLKGVLRKLSPVYQAEPTKLKLSGLVAKLCLGGAGGATRDRPTKGYSWREPWLLMRSSTWST